MNTVRTTYSNNQIHNYIYITIIIILSTLNIILYVSLYAAIKYKYEELSEDRVNVTEISEKNLRLYFGSFIMKLNKKSSNILGKWFPQSRLHKNIITTIMISLVIITSCFSRHFQSIIIKTKNRRKYIKY